jgi:hypothetical protein
VSRSDPIRINSVHLLVAAGCEASGHSSAQPHDVTRDQPLILVANQQVVLSPQPTEPGQSHASVLPCTVALYKRFRLA